MLPTAADLDVLLLHHAVHSFQIEFRALEPESAPIDNLPSLNFLWFLNFTKSKVTCQVYISYLALLKMILTEAQNIITDPEQ